MSLARPNRAFGSHSPSSPRSRGRLSALRHSRSLRPPIGGCADGTSGFRPLYGSSAVGGADVAEKLAAVDIAPIPGRVGQRLRNEFIFQATGGGDALPPEYRLEIAIRESVSSTLVKIDGNARGQVYHLDASFKLIRVADKSVVLKGMSYGRAGFERVYLGLRQRPRARRRREPRCQDGRRRDCARGFSPISRSRSDHACRALRSSRADPYAMVAVKAGQAAAFLKTRRRRSSAVLFFGSDPGLVSERSAAPRQAACRARKPAWRNPAPRRYRPRPGSRAASRSNSIPGRCSLAARSSAPQPGGASLRQRSNPSWPPASMTAFSSSRPATSKPATPFVRCSKTRRRRRR